MVSLTQENVTSRNYHENSTENRSFRGDVAKLSTFNVFQCFLSALQERAASCRTLFFSEFQCFSLFSSLSVSFELLSIEDALRCSSASQKWNSFIKCDRGWMKLNQRCEPGRINPKQTARPTSRPRRRSIANCVSEEIRTRVEMWNLCKMEKNGRKNFSKWIKEIFLLMNSRRREV